jgi:hypothetical protein
MLDEAVRNAFTGQAKACDTLGSPFTARLCRVVAHRLSRATTVGETILSWSGDPSSSGDSVPLRLAGALHALVLMEKIEPLTGIPHEEEEALWQACEQAFQSHTDFILDRLKSPPQTNEVRRSGALLPGFLTIAELFRKPLVLSEVGASAGLNLQFDRYQYALGGMHWGTDSPVRLSPEWHGPPPPQAEIIIKDRAGCDLNPLDPSSDADRLRLMSYIWADQIDRLERTRNALKIAVENDLNVDRADAIDWLKQRLATPFEGSVHVVYHTIAWQYLPSDLQQHGETLIAAAGARSTTDAPLARLQMEADDKKGATLNLQIWPTGEKHEIGRADFHGRWIDWTGWPLDRR